MSLEYPSWEKANEGAKKVDSTKVGEDLIAGVLKRTETARHRESSKRMYEHLRSLTKDDLKRIIEGESNRDLKAAAHIVLQEKGQEDKKPSKKKREKREGVSISHDSGSEKSGSQSDYEFQEDTVTSGGGDETPSESAEFDPQNMNLDDIIRLIVDERYKEVQLTPVDQITKTAAGLVANIIQKGLKPREYTVKLEDETDMVKLKRQMEMAAFGTAEDMQREFNRLSAKADRIKSYATEKASGVILSDSDSTVTLYGKEVAGYMAEGLDVEHAYARMLVRRMDEKLFNSLANTLGQHLR